jgi:hypothetical protein
MHATMVWPARRCLVLGAALMMALAGILLWCVNGAASGEVKMVGQFTYPMEHAGPARRCAVEARYEGAGKVVWSRQVSSNERGRAVTGLLLWHDRPVVSLASTTRVFTPDGTNLWERARLPHSPVAVGNGLLYYENNNYKLDAVNPSNELELDSVPFPVAMDAEVHVRLMWPMPKAMLAVAFWPGREPDQKPDILWAKTVYGHRIGEQGGNIRQWLHLPPVYVPEQDRLCLCAGDTIECISVGEGNKVASFAIPIKVPVDWHADAHGALCLIGYEGDRKVLVGLSPAGAVTWRWIDAESPDRWVEGQPPVQGGEGNVFALTERRLLAFRNGKLAWQYESKEAPLRRATSLADGSILITAGKKLLHLGADGKEHVSVALDGEIVTSPVVDTQGHVYVATETHLIRID